MWFIQRIRFIFKETRWVACDTMIVTRLTACRKSTGAAETAYEFYIGPWTKIRSNPVWSRCSATPGPRQVYIVSRVGRPSVPPHACYTAPTLFRCAHVLAWDRNRYVVWDSDMINASREYRVLDNKPIWRTGQNFSPQTRIIFCFPKI